MESLTFASLENLQESLIDEDENLEPGPECCIYRVPKFIRKPNEEAYTPQVISIGPLHHGNPDLAYMEKQKIRYMKEFSNRHDIMKTWQDDFVNLIVREEQRIRNCYEEMPKFEKRKFLTMVLYDAVFIIELLMKNRSEPCSYKPVLYSAIISDLQLLENQLPYFILENLLCKAFPYYVRSFLELCCDLFIIQSDLGNIEVKHFTDLRRHALKKRYTRKQCETVTSAMPCPCAIKLQQSGEIFKEVKEECLLNISLKKELRIPFPWLEVCELTIPTIEIFDDTESLFRNLIALEQCHYPEETYICNYAYVMDSLINTEKGVNLLVEARIITNHLGNSAKVANLFNNICQNIILANDPYTDLHKNLNDHYGKSWNHAVATLKSVYFNNRWRGTATLAAIMLLVLTLIQTICSVLQVM